MHYNIAICDDSCADRSYIRQMTESWARQYDHTLQVKEFGSAEQFLFDYEDQSDYDILLLDIEMGQMDGVTMAKKLRQHNDTVQIIFVTGYSDYIAEGYEVAALHYLMKPVGEEKLFAVLERAVQKISKNEKILHLQANAQTVHIPIYRIKYAEVMGNYVTIHAAEPVTVKMTLGELEKELDSRFYRVSRSAIVNLQDISRVTKTEIRLHDGSSIPLPRGAYDGVNRAIIDMR